MNCRFCSQPLSHLFADLGEAPPSNSFLSKEDLAKPELNYPLKLFVCDHCFLVQLEEFKKATEIFSGDYLYFSSFSTSWLQHAKEYARMMIDRFNYNSHSLVLEIASNDGYLLQYFKESGIPVLGIEPTKSTAEVSIGKGIRTIMEFFGVALAEKLINDGLKADLIVGNNVLAHVPDINDFVSGMKKVLAADGVITMEFPHLMNLVLYNQFDTIYQEHYSYLSFHTVSLIFESHGLELFDVEQIATHGGSLRIFANHKNAKSREISTHVKTLRNKEEQLGMRTLGYYEGFQKKISSIEAALMKFLRQQKDEKKRVIAYGAAAKGNTLFNYCKIDSDLIPLVIDKSPFKQGKYLPGSKIPVVDESFILSQRPDFILILPWNIQQEIIGQLKYAKEWGCRFVVAIPSLQII